MTSRPTVMALARRLIAAFAAMWLTCLPVAAQTLDKALDRLFADSFPETIAAVEEIARSGDEKAATILEALADRRILIDAASKTILIKSTSGSLTDARTGAAVATAPADAAPVRTNNRVRGAIEAAIGGLTLLSPDTAKRLSAADAVFKSRDAKALPVLEQALAREKDPAAKRALARARASVLLADPSVGKADLEAAVEALIAAGDAEALGLIRARLTNTTDPVTRGLLQSAIDKASRDSARWRWHRTCGSACRSARCCCSPRSASPSRSA